MVVHKLRGKDPWKITRLPGSILFGPSVTKPPGSVPRDIAKGLFAHFVFSVAVGLLYPKLVRNMRAGPIGAGLRSSATLFALGFVILPYVLLPARTAPMRLPPKSLALNAVSHVLYGVTFGLAYRLLDRKRSSSAA